MVKVAVTGATGFLGLRLVDRLLKEGHQVVTHGRNRQIGSQLEAQGAQFIASDITDQAAIEQLCEGAEAVFHVAGLSSPWGHYRDFEQANLVGTQTVIAACFKHNVKRLIQVSTPSIYVEQRSRENIRESDPLPVVKFNAYAQTKWLAEQEVLKAQAQGLETIMIRPRALIGSGDTVIMPRLLRAHAEGRLKVIGDGQNKVDLTSVSNVVDALLLCWHAPQSALGQAYNITNGEPVKLWDFLGQVLERMGLKLDRRKIPFAVAYGIAKAMETAAKFDPQYREPALTCYSVTMLGKSQTLNIDKARQQLGYVPRQSTEEAVTEFLGWYKN